MPKKLRHLDALTARVRSDARDGLLALLGRLTGVAQPPHHEHLHLELLRIAAPPDQIPRLR